jgi:hypothetical protein
MQYQFLIPAAILPNGEKLGLRPGEYAVIAFEAQE